MDGKKGTFRCFSVQPTDITIMELEWYCCIEVWWIGTCWWCDCFVRCYSLYRPCKHAFRMCYTVNVRFFLTGSGMLQQARLFLAVLRAAWDQCIVIVFSTHFVHKFLHMFRSSFLRWTVLSRDVSPGNEFHRIVLHPAPTTTSSSFTGSYYAKH